VNFLSARSDYGCVRFSNTRKSLKKHPTEYLMVFAEVQWLRPCGPRAVMKAKVGQAVSPVNGAEGDRLLRESRLPFLQQLVPVWFSRVPPTFPSARIF